MAERLTVVSSKVGTSRKRRAFSVIQITLDTGENVPVLVRNLDWIPTLVPTRWVIRHRRFACMENTLSRDLRGIAALYEWAATAFGVDLDVTLERSEIPPGRQLESLIAFLRRGTAVTGLNSLATVALKARSIHSFLMWVVDPGNQGSSQRKSIQQTAEERGMLTALFRPLERYSASGERIQPLLPSEVNAIETLFGPVRDENHRISLPLRFDDHNPFHPKTRLRNWLMMAMSHQCGHRRGELLKTRIDDIPRSTDAGLKIRRRPHDPADSRRYKPRAKTVERILPVSAELRIGLRAYLSSPPPAGRPSGGTPYLFVSGTGAPLSIPTTDEIVKVVARHAEVSNLSWHSFRHTWAEALAEDLLDHYPNDHAFEIIRDLGGWKRGSNVPMHYIQNALSKRGVEFLRERNSHLYPDPRKNSPGDLGRAFCRSTTFAFNSRRKRPSGREHCPRYLAV